MTARLRLQADGEPMILLADTAAELVAVLADLAADINTAQCGSLRLDWGPENVSAELTKRGMKRKRVRAA